MYDAIDDPYCYPGSSVLKNLPGLTSQEALDRFEAVASGRRFLEPMPTGRWGVSHYRAIHRHIFQDVYVWAGRFRSVLTPDREEPTTALACQARLEGVGDLF